MSVETIRCAALRFGETVVCGFEHYEAYLAAGDACYGLVIEEGFVTSAGRFVDRDEAYRVAVDAAQCAPRHNERWLDYSDVAGDAGYGGAP